MPLTNPSNVVPTKAGATVITNLTISTDAVTGKQSAMLVLVNTLTDANGNVTAQQGQKMLNIPDLAKAAQDVPAIASLLTQAEGAILQAVVAYCAAKKVPGFDKIQFSQ